MGYIPKQSLEGLRKYTYNSVDKSITSKYILNPFWNQLVKLWPKWIAPNTITATGLSLVGLNFITLLVLRPSYRTPKDGAEELPFWVFYSWAIGLFLYQSLDAIDGKQARRTGMAGPLGEMFDHGCDALNTTLEVLLASYALNLGQSWWTVAMQIATVANFYLTTWEEYHTGQLFLGIFSGPVEGILMIVAIYTISGLYGTSVWDTGILTFLRIDRILPSDPGSTKTLAHYISNLNIPLNEAFMVFGGLGLALNIVTSWSNVYTFAKSSRKSPFVPLFNLLPFVISTSTYLLWLAAPWPAEQDQSPTHTFSPSSSAIVHSSLLLPFLCTWGLQFAHQVGRIILAHVTQQKHMPWFGSDGGLIWAICAAGAVDANAGWIFGRPPTLITTRTSLTLAVYTTLLLSFVSYVRFCYLVIHDITEFLGIACFKVQRRDMKGVWRNPVTDEKVRVAQNGTGGVKYVGPEKGKKGRKEKGKKWY